MNPASFLEFRNRHAGATIVVCGCGASLKEFNHPEEFITIGVNDVGRQFQPTYLVVVNPRNQFSADRFRHVESSRAQAIFSQLDLKLNQPVVRFRLGQYGGTDSSDPGVLHFTRNSPYVAVGLAVHLGAKRIGLIGVDFTDHHFFGSTGRHALSRSIGQIDDEYRKLGSALGSRGIEIVNLSRQSRLTAFPKVELPVFKTNPVPKTSGGNHAQPATAAPATVPTPIPAAGPASAGKVRRIFFVHYRFLACGEVFRTGLMHAAAELKVAADEAHWDDPALVEKVDRFKPELLFVVHGRRFAQRSAELARRYPSAVWLLDEPYEVDDTARFSRAFRWVFVNDRGTLSRHQNAYYLPVCFDSQTHCDPGLVRTHRVGFIGGYNPARERFLVRLVQDGLLSYVIGGPWKTAVLRKLLLADRSTPEETTLLYQRTQIVLNVFRSVHHFNQQGIAGTALNPRIFEALACGALPLSEPRPELHATFPELPTFHDEESLVAAIRALLAEPRMFTQTLEASRARLAGEDYTHRLRQVIETVFGPNIAPPTASPAAPPATPKPATPEGWQPIGTGVRAAGEAGLVLVGDGTGETGLTSEKTFTEVRLSFQVHIERQCFFIAKIHHAAKGDCRANSYHLVATPEHGYVARHGVILGSIALARDTWQRIEMAWKDGEITMTVDGRELCRRPDRVIPEGHCFVGVTHGTATVRDLQIESTPASPGSLPGWTVEGRGQWAASGAAMELSAEAGRPVSLVCDTPLNDLELEFAVRLEPGAHFIAKVHHQTPNDGDANSYHLLSTPGQCYLARHNKVLARATLPRDTWQRILLRWIDQRLELYLNGRVVAQACDNLLQSGYSVISVTKGKVAIRDLVQRDLAATAKSARREITTRRNGSDSLPFTASPRRNLIYHVWPVRGGMWRWNVEQLRARIDLFNGRRIVGIVHDSRSEDPEEVRKAFAGDGCEFVVAQNGPAGEGLTFPAMLAQVQSVDPNEVTFYGHAKGVKYEPTIPTPVRRWASTLYRTTLDDWPSVRSQLERFAMTGSFKMLGRFRAHHYAGDWHYSGTFFWLRHALVFARNVAKVHPFYGGVEAWPGVHFRREETGCLLLDGLRQLPYLEDFWQGTGNAAFARWESERTPLAPPASLRAPPPFEGHVEPRLEQHPAEFAWLLDEWTAAQPQSVLTIGSMHGGVEWHLARRFRELGRTVRITAVDIEARPELLATFADARRRFGQPIEFVHGDSTTSATRSRLAHQYDAVFIDGDHSYRSSRADLDFAFSRSPRTVALHDIADSEWHAQAKCAVSRVWQELRNRHQTAERIVGEWGGIGLVRL